MLGRATDIQIQQFSIQILILTFFAIFTARDNTFSFFIARPVFLACQTKTIAATCGTARRTGHTFLTFFIGIVAIGAAIQTFTIVSKATGTTSDAL